MSPLLRNLSLSLVLLTLLRMALAAVWDVTPQEAYLWQLGKHGTLIGCDGGGLPGLLTFAANWFPQSSLALRALVPLLALVGSWCLFRLMTQLANESTAAWSVVFLNLLPAFNLAAIHLQREWIAAYFVLGGIHLVWLALHRAGKFSWYWPVAGALWGLGLNCSWVALSAPISLAVLILASRRWRKRTFSPGVWSLLAIWFAVGCLPLVIWNAMHGGAVMIQFLSSMGWLQRGWFQWRTMVDMLGNVHLGLSALVILAIWVCVQRVLRVRPREDAAYFLLAFSLPTILLAVLLSFFGLGNVGLLFPTYIPLCGLLTKIWNPRSVARDRQGLWQWLVLTCAATYSLLTVNTDILRQIGLSRSYGWDDSRHRMGWRETVSEIAKLSGVSANNFGSSALLIAESPELAAILDFYLPETTLVSRDDGYPRVQVLESSVATSQYAFWPRYDETRNGVPPEIANALYITDNDARETPPHLLQAGFDSVTLARVFDLKRFGSTVRLIRVYYCQNYRGLPY